MELLAVASSLLLTLLAVLVGMAKVQHLPASLQIRDAAAIAPALWRLSGWVDLVAAALLVVGIFAAHGAALVAAVVLALDFAALGIRLLARPGQASTAAPALLLVALSAVVVVAIALAG